MATSRARPTRAALVETDKTPIPTDLPDTLQFMRLLWAIVHALQKTSKRMATELGITGPQRLVLRVVGLFPGVSAGNLAAILHVHPSTLTGVLQRLVEQQLLLRSEHVLDRRRAVLNLTPRGARVNAIRVGTIEAAVARGLRNVGGHDRTITRRVLATLTEHLEQPSAPRPVRRAAGTKR
jgi:DNA-binding MarR family transcriptional regulator